MKTLIEGTYEQYRRSLPGYEHRNVILGSYKPDRSKKLIHVSSIRGFMDELLFVQNFWVQSNDGRAEITKTFDNFNEAVKYYTSLP
jgi:hypothetical protein